MKIFAMVAAFCIVGMGVASAQCGANGCGPVRQVVQGVTFPVQNFVQGRQVVRQQRQMQQVYRREYRQTQYGVVSVLVPVYTYTYTVR